MNNLKIMGLFKELLDDVKDIGNDVKDVGNDVKSIGDDFKDGFKDVGNDFKDIFKDVGNDAKDLFKDFGNDVIGVFKDDEEDENSDNYEDDEDDEDDENSNNYEDDEDDENGDNYEDNENDSADTTRSHVRTTGTLENTWPSPKKVKCPICGKITYINWAGKIGFCDECGEQVDRESVAAANKDNSKYVFIIIAIVILFFNLLIMCS